MKSNSQSMNALFAPDAEDEMTLVFLQSKGYGTDRLAEAREWIKKADPDELMLGEGTGDPFDVTMGELRRPILLESVERLIKKNKE